MKANIQCELDTGKDKRFKFYHLLINSLEYQLISNCIIAALRLYK